MQTSDERKQAIARLVAAGKMTREEPGRYAENGYEGELPDYDPAEVRKAFPDLLEIGFDEVPSDQWYAVLEDGKTGEATRVPLGSAPPPDSDALIEVIHAFFRGALDQDNMDETARALASFDEMED